jgi:major membrane immunogen (membrane-anchored lipoprotein)
MKKILVIALILAVAITGTAFAQKLADGLYFAEQPTFGKTGWKEQAVIEVKGGKIVSAKWNGVNNLGVADKKTVASSGGYGMAKAAKQGEWDVQAARVEAALVKAGDVARIPVKSDGYTDAIAGVSMHVKDFLDLVSKALAAGPVAKGTYKKDGWFYAKAPEFDKGGYAATALVTVVNGRIVSAVINGVPKAGGDSKYIAAIKGTYKMSSKSGEWNVQSDRVGQAIVKTQDVSKIAVKSDGKTDAIAGVSVSVGDYLKAVAEALKSAK